jgi:RNA polymerase primary sigma factor
MSGAISREEIELMLVGLPHRERAILEYRLGLRDDRSHTREEVSREFGVTCERIRHIEAKALIERMSPRQEC